MKLLAVLSGTLLLAPPLSADLIHQWTFEQGLEDSVGGADLELRDGATRVGGRLLLDGIDDYAISIAPLPAELAERTLVAWVKPANLTQQGGGILTTVRPLTNDVFDGIVLGERIAGQWMNGSNSFQRTVSDHGGSPETETEEVMIAIRYGPGDSISIYRNDLLYSLRGATLGSRVTYPAGSTFVHLGERHNTSNPNRFFAGEIKEARIYDEALLPTEIAQLYAQGPVPEAGSPEHGTIEVVQLNTGNGNLAGGDPGVTASLGPAASPGSTIREDVTNRGDFHVVFPPANDIAAGVLVPAVAQINRDSSIAPDVGGPSGLRTGTTGIAPFEADTEYFIPVHAAGSSGAGAEFNINVSFAWFPYSDWLGAVTDGAGANGANLTALASHPEVDLGSEFFQEAAGRTIVDLRALGGRSDEGILLVTSARNEANYAFSEALNDGRFRIYSHDNNVNAATYEQDAIGFAYLPVSAVGTKSLVALGRIKQSAGVEVGAGDFAVQRLGAGRFLVTIPGHSPETGTFLANPCASQPAFNSDNIVVSGWDAEQGGWEVRTLDLVGLGPQDTSSGEVDVFSFAFFASRPPLDEGPASDTPVLTKNARVTQSSTFPSQLPDRTDAGQAIDFDLSATNRTATDAVVEQAWLEIELERPALIESVEILNLSGPLGPDCCRSRLRDIIIQVLEARPFPPGGLNVSSPLLNPENRAFTFPDGPRTLSHRFNLTEPAQVVRINRLPDPDLSGTGGQGDPLEEANILAVREVIIRGHFVDDDPTVEPASIVYDSRRADPNPATQGFYGLETVRGSDFSARDGLVDSGSNVGTVIQGTEAVWQTRDELTGSTTNLPIFYSNLSEAVLREFHEFGWEFEVEAKWIAGSDDRAGFVGWAFDDLRNPGWDIGTATGGRFGFNLQRNASDRIEIQTDSGFIGGSGNPDSFHTIRLVGAPRSRSFEVFFNGQSVGTTELGEVFWDNRVGFGSGSSAATRTANWRRVALRATPLPDKVADDSLAMYLPFEPGERGRDFLQERSRSPEGKPRVEVVLNTAESQLDPQPDGAVGGAAVLGFDQLLIKDAAGPTTPEEGLSASFWYRASEGANRSLLEFQNSIGSPRTSLRVTGLSPVNSLLIFAGGDQFTANGLTITDGEWHHLALTTNEDRTRLFLDGQLLTTQSQFIYASSVFATGTRLELGNITDNELDEVMLWTRELSETEVRSLYQRGFLREPFTEDADRDGLNAFEERNLGTDDDTPDSDQDGLGDREELVLRTDPRKADTDGDSIADGDELLAGTDPRRADSDGDGFDDPFESRQGKPANEQLEAAVGGLFSYRFSVDGAVSNPRVESSPSLAGFVELPTARIIDEGGGSYLATFTPPPGHRFFRIRTDEGVLTDPIDPNSFPPRPPEDNDRDGDGFENAIETLLGSDPDDPDSIPGGSPAGNLLAEALPAAAGSGELRADRFTRLPNGDIEFDFTVIGNVGNLRLQSAEGLDGFGDLTTAVITDNGGGEFTATATPPAGHRFFRAAGDTDDGPVTTRSADFVLPADGIALSGREGGSLTIPILLGGSFTGTIQFEVSGISPTGQLLSGLPGSIEVSNSDQVDLVLSFADDFTVGNTARYTITLREGPGIAVGLNGGFTVVVADNDAVWSGVFRVADENLDFTLTVLEDQARRRAFFTTSGTSGLLPAGSFPVTTTFGEHSFEGRAGNILLGRTSEDVTSPPARIEALILSAMAEEPNQQVLPDLIVGETSLSLSSDDGSAVDRAGTFDMVKQPPPPSPDDVTLEPSN